ncbi:MAG: Dna2/Cas4 domain-containing protein [Deltaproteobacteria bacterium]|nr:MAG: Dna2/Cas4 domain-containing protein [Deltaproteobacteria bacterium]
MKELFTSASAAARLERAAEWLARRRKAEQVLVIGATAEAASELVRQVAQPAAFGWRRLTLGRLAALSAAEALARRGLSPLSSLGLEALCARVVHQMGRANQLGRFQPIAAQPGLARALARTLVELRMAGARPEGDLGRILDEYQALLAEKQLADRAEVFRLAESSPLFRLPALLVDLPVRSALEERLVARLSGGLLAVAPKTDAERLSRALGVAAQELEEPADSSLARVQRHLFVEGAPPAQALGKDVVVLSAPGESRECVEIARLVRREAERGVPFDRMAVLLRSPGQYRALLEEAFARAGVPAYFAQGTVKPDPAGRAFLALLACAAENSSARRFAEYLSLGEVPDATAQGAPPQPPPAGDRWVPPDADLTVRPGDEPETERDPSPPAAVDAPVVAGALRAPWRWERLLIEAAVIKGRDRWEKRLEGLAGHLRAQLAAQAEDEAQAQKRRRELDDLAALRAFALPLLDALSQLPQQATWGEWLEPLTALATQSLREPARVLSLLAELAPMAPVGPVSLAEVRLVLGRRLTELAWPPSGRRYGKVYVAPVPGARGLAFDVVFVPGLAEKMFPQKVVEDPLLRDKERAGLPDLDTGEDRVAAERLALQLAAGAARKKLVLSWPRIDLQQGRARVPSFYGLEVLRAAEGVLPSFADLSRRAERAAFARLGWPAPREAQDAIDEAEHDLALLERAFRSPEESRGTANYLLESNPHLARALRARARRWIKRWTPADGLVLPSPEALEALQRHQPAARSYSPTALQNFAACPYKFVLQAVHRLAPREVPEAIDAIDPLARGSLIHEVQYEFLQQLALPIADLGRAQKELEGVVDRVAARWREQLCPAIDRVWDDCINGVKVDLREWLRRSSEERDWMPWRFELAFGLADQENRDSHSTADPVALDEGLQLRGSIDLVERKADGALRATDHKTGKIRAEPGVVIGGGATLQPALYALALEKLFPGERVEEGRLYYCTYTGDFTAVSVPLDGKTRESVKALASTVADAVQRGFLPAAPREGECQYCDYLAVCGPHEEQRVKRKPAGELQALVQLPGMP